MDTDTYRGYDLMLGDGYVLVFWDGELVDETETLQEAHDVIDAWHNAP